MKQFEEIYLSENNKIMLKTLTLLSKSESDLSNNF